MNQTAADVSSGKFRKSSLYLYENNSGCIRLQVYRYDAQPCHLREFQIENSKFKKKNKSEKPKQYSIKEQTVH